MAKSKNQEDQEDQAAIMKRMDEALKKALSTPHETNEQMIKRRRGAGEAPSKKKKKGAS